MNNAISRLLEAATAEAPEWFNKLSPEAQERYLSLHPQSSLHGQGGSSEDEKQSPSDEEYDRAFDEHKHGVTEEEKKGQKSTDVVPYGEKRGSDGEFESKDENKTGTDVVPKGKRKNSDATDVDFKEIPRGSKESPKLNAPEKKAEESPKKESPKKESPKSTPEKKPESKETPKAPASKKETPKKAPEKKADKPSAVDRIRDDEEDEKTRRADRAEERREEKHQHQMDVMRRKEEERQADRAEKKRKAEEKDSEKKPDENKPPETKPVAKKPVPKKDDKKPEKKEEKKDTHKSGGFGESKPSEKSGPSGSRSEPAAEQHKPNAMPNENGGPNPHGKEGGGEGSHTPSSGGGDISPVPPNGTPSKPTPPKPSPHQPSPPDDTDVNFEDAPSPGPKPVPGQPSPESEKRGPSGAEFKSQQPSQPESGDSHSDSTPVGKSEAPKVEEKPGAQSERAEMPEVPKAEPAPQVEEPEGSGEVAPTLDGNEPQAPMSGEGAPEAQEHAPMPGEQAPESDQPDVEAPAPFEQQHPEAPAAEAPQTPKVNAPNEGVDRLRDPDETPTGKEGGDVEKQEPFGETPEKEDQGQQSKGFGAPPAGGMNAPKPSGSYPSGGPEKGGGAGMQNRGQDVKQQQLTNPNDPYASKAPNIPGHEQNVPKPAGERAPHEQVKETPTAPNSQARTNSAQAIRAQAPNIAQRLMKDTAGVPKGLAAMYNILEGRGTAQDGRAALSLLGTILGTAASMAATGASGPIGFATFMAIKHAGIPAMVAIVKKAFSGSMPTMNPEHQQEDLKRLVESAADYAQSGSIPAQAWQAGVKEAQQQRG